LVARASARGARSSRRLLSARSGFDAWLAERDPDFAAKAVASIELELHPPGDGPTFGVDEKTGIGVRRPAAPSQPVASGRPARREFESVRNGTADLLAADDRGDLAVAHRERRQHRSREFCELLDRLDRLDRQTPFGQTIHLILEPVSLHRSAEVAVWLASRPWRPFVFHWLPIHASWLSCVDACFAILSKKCLTRSERPDFDAAERALSDFIATHDAQQAHPFTWRKGVRFYQRLKDKLAAPTQMAA
jgi:hypothetical protein